MRAGRAVRGGLWILLASWVVLPSAASGQKTLSIALSGTHPRSDFATGWRDGLGLEAAFQWRYWRSMDASVSLTLADHSPKDDENPEVLLGVWTFGVHWKPGVARTLDVDLMVGAQSHTAVFHRGLEKFEGEKGFDESDLGSCLGIGFGKRLWGRWRAILSVRTNTIFTEPEWVHYETVALGLGYGGMD